jgi:hypothetical protein
VNDQSPPHRGPGPCRHHRRTTRPTSAVACPRVLSFETDWVQRSPWIHDKAWHGRKSNITHISPLKELLERQWSTTCICLLGPLFDSCPTHWLHRQEDEEHTSPGAMAAVMGFLGTFNLRESVFLQPGKRCSHQRVRCPRLFAKIRSAIASPSIASRFTSASVCHLVLANPGVDRLRLHPIKCLIRQTQPGGPSLLWTMPQRQPNSFVIFRPMVVLGSLFATAYPAGVLSILLNSHSQRALSGGLVIWTRFAGSMSGPDAAARCTDLSLLPLSLHCDPPPGQPP